MRHSLHQYAYLFLPAIVLACCGPAERATAAGNAPGAFQPMTGLFHNEDCTQIFYMKKFPEGKAGEVIDAYVDVMADAGVKVFLCNTNARKTCYQGRAWESFWDGYDPAGPDDQPFLKGVEPNDVAFYRNLIGNMMEVHRQGIDYPARVIARCRHDGMSPWISLRMNDCHFNNIAEHPFHGTFWKNNPQFKRKGRADHFQNCLDYARPEVRDYYKALIVETLDNYDIDGLELDFMRETFLFSEGREAEGMPILTAWLRDMRKLVDAAAAKRGHPIRLGVRVPSHPEVALGLGLDAITWAKEGLIDLLVVTPRWVTLEFDMPLAQWRQLLGPSKVTLAGGLEVRYLPHPGAAVSSVSAELARGAATAVLSDGADAVYLFNYFQGDNPTLPREKYLESLRAMNSLDALLKLPRTVGVTYREILAPKESYRSPLPATGRELAFSLRLGPMPNKEGACSVRIGLTPVDGQAAPAVQVNGKPCALQEDTVKETLRFVSYAVPAAAIADSQTLDVKITGKDDKPLTVQQVEASVTP